MRGKESGLEILQGLKRRSENFWQFQESIFPYSWSEEDLSKSICKTYKNADSGSSSRDERIKTFRELSIQRMLRNYHFKNTHISIVHSFRH